MRRPAKPEVGQCVKWNLERGYGFLRVGDGSPDVFVHFSALPHNYPSLSEGQWVHFVRIKGSRGYRATGIEIVP